MNRWRSVGETLEMMAGLLKGVPPLDGREAAEAWLAAMEEGSPERDHLHAVLHGSSRRRTEAFLPSHFGARLAAAVSDPCAPPGAKPALPCVVLLDRDGRAVAALSMRSRPGNGDEADSLFVLDQAGWGAALADIRDDAGLLSHPHSGALEELLNLPRSSMLEADARSVHGVSVRPYSVLAVLSDGTGEPREWLFRTEDGKFGSTDGSLDRDPELHEDIHEALQDFLSAPPPHLDAREVSDRICVTEEGREWLEGEGADISPRRSLPSP